VKGGLDEPIFSYEFKCTEEVRNLNRETWEQILSQQTKNLEEFCKNKDTNGIFRFSNSFDYVRGDDKISGETGISFRDYKEAKKKFKYDKIEYDEIIKKLIILIKNIKKSFKEFGVSPHNLPSGYDKFEVVIPKPSNNPNSSNNSNNPNSSNSSNISKFSYKEFLTYLHQELEKEYYLLTFTCKIIKTIYNLFNPFLIF
jgi:hypothetical protein